MQRKEILPKWIRFFAWIFLISALALPFFVAGLFLEGEYKLSFLSLEYVGTHTRHPLACYITAMFALASTVAYGILWGKDWAIRLGLVYASLALLTTLAATISSFANGEIYIGLEPLLLIPFLIILKQRQGEWARFTSPSGSTLGDQTANTEATDEDGR